MQITLTTANTIYDLWDQLYKVDPTLTRKSCMIRNIRPADSNTVTVGKPTAALSGTMGSGTATYASMSEEWSGSVGESEYRSSAPRNGIPVSGVAIKGSANTTLVDVEVIES